MIREMDIKDRENIDKMQFELQKYFSEIDQTHESLPYKDMDDAHRYMQKMLDDVKNMNGKVFVSEENGQVIGFIQGTNDRFASPVEVRKAVGNLAEVVEIIDADHSYRNSQKEPVYQDIAIKELIKWIK